MPQRPPTSTLDPQEQALIARLRALKAVGVLVAVHAPDLLQRAIERLSQAEAAAGAAGWSEALIEAEQVTARYKQWASRLNELH